MAIQNINTNLYRQKGKTLNSWGKDSTGKIIYKINNQGFRSDVDFTFKPDYVFFGNSNVFGIGLNLEDTVVSQFPNAHNYGLAGLYSNRDSVENLKSFVDSPLYDKNVKIIFFWVERPGIEDVNVLLTEVNNLQIDVLHISQGHKYGGMINLWPSVDEDVSGTHSGPRTHKIWAKTIKQLLNRL